MLGSIALHITTPIPIDKVQYATAIRYLTHMYWKFEGQMNPLKHTHSLFVIITFLMCPNVLATSVVFIIAPTGIYIGADTKVLEMAFTGRRTGRLLPPEKKTTIVQDRLIVA